MPAGIVATAAFNDLKSGSQLLAHIMFADDTNLFYSLSSFNLPQLKTNDHGIFFSIRGFFRDTNNSQDSSGREGAILIALYHFHPLMIIQTFNFNFIFEMTTLYF